MTTLLFTSKQRAYSSIQANTDFKLEGSNSTLSLNVNLKFLGPTSVRRKRKRSYSLFIVVTMLPRQIPGPSTFDDMDLLKKPFEMLEAGSLTEGVWSALQDAIGLLPDDIGVVDTVVKALKAFTSVSLITLHDLT